VAKTDGVPLFVEELTKMVLESDLLQEQEERYELSGPLPPLVIPATLHDSLMARLDRLATVKSLAQLAATLGREFSYALLQAVAPWDEAALHRGLHQLVEAEFLYQQGLPPHATYLFKHALIQDAAYQSLLRSTRQQHHQRIAQVLEARFPEIVAAQPEVVAHHYTEAGLSAQALPYWQRAGQRAIERYANLEAVAHLKQGLEVLATLLETPERTQHELTLQAALGASLMAVKGFSAPEVERAYARAHELCQQVGDTPQLCLVLWGLLQFSIVRADIQMALELGERLISLAQSIHDLDILLAAHNGLGTALPFCGELHAARTHLEQSLALYDPLKHHARAFFYGTNLQADSLAHLAHVLWLQGYPEQALQRGHEALSVAQAQEPVHAFTLAHVANLIAVVHALRREERLAQERTETARRLSSEHGFAAELGRGTILWGWALVVQGQAEGLGQMHQGSRGLSGDGGRGMAALLPGPAGRGVWHRGTECRGVTPADGGARCGRQQWGALVGSRTVSAQRRTPPRARWPRPPRGGGRAVFSAGARHSATPARQIPGAAGRHEPESSLAGAGQTRSGSSDVSGDLRLVHRGLRHG